MNLIQRFKTRPVPTIIIFALTLAAAYMVLELLFVVEDRFRVIRNTYTVCALFVEIVIDYLSNLV